MGKEPLRAGAGRGAPLRPAGSDPGGATWPGLPRAGSAWQREGGHQNGNFQAKRCPDEEPQCVGDCFYLDFPSLWDGALGEEPEERRK